MTSPVDHLVYAAPDLREGIRNIEQLLAVKPVMGGSHPGSGTRNALLRLGPMCYLEIIGPDPEQTNFRGNRPFGIDSLTAPRLMNWAARRSDLPEFIQRVNAQENQLSELIPMSRVNPEGTSLNWQLAFPVAAQLSQLNVLPFFIDWGETRHPALDCTDGAQLLDLELQHPENENILQIATLFELAVNVTQGELPALIARIECSRGTVMLS